jgi:hypothetical protein
MKHLATVVFAALVAVALTSGSSRGATAGPQSNAQAPVANDWTATAATLRGSNGQRFVFECPSYGVVSSLWGTDTYTDDSSVCTAALFEGRITLAGGGTVTIEIRPGQSSYTGSTRNGVRSADWGSWGGSFVVVAATPRAPGIGEGGKTWSDNATRFRTWIGARFAYTCPPNGTPGNVWGTDVYTDDSSVCTAAVHAGLITLARGGRVVIEMRGGQDSYRGTKRNGIESQSYPAWPTSFVIIGAPGGPPDGTATGTVVVNGQPFTSGPVPLGATVDVTKGRLTLQADVGTLQVYGAGATAIFVPTRATEKVKGKTVSLIQLTLVGGNFGVCSTKKMLSGRLGATAKKKPKVVRALWGNGKGRFRTRGRHAAATVRGTEWLTADRCDGTLTTVKKGVVAVTDFTRKKTVTVKAGKSYLAPARR